MIPGRKANMNKAAFWNVFGWVSEESQETLSPNDDSNEYHYWSKLEKYEITQKNIHKAREEEKNTLSSLATMLLYSSRGEHKMLFHINR